MTIGWDSWQRRLALAFVAAVAVASLAGLRAAAGESATDPTATGSRAAGARIVDFAYRPATLRISRGTRVTFTNRGGTAHTVTQNGGGFDTGRIRPGKSARLTFKRRGSFAFHCTIHPFMKGRIVVE